MSKRNTEFLERRCNADDLAKVKRFSERDMEIENRDTDMERAFGKRQALARTPPHRRGSIPIDSGAAVDGVTVEAEKRKRGEEASEDMAAACSAPETDGLDPNEEDPRLAKRKKGGSPTGKTIRANIEKLDAQCKIIAAISKERNTKVGVKEASVSLSHLMRKLMAKDTQLALEEIDRQAPRVDRVMKEELEAYRKENERLHKYIKRLKENMQGLGKTMESKELGVQVERSSGPECKEIGTQTDDQTDGLDEEAIRKKLAEWRHEEEALELAKIHWPEGVYNITETVKRNPLDIDGDLAIYVGDDTPGRGNMKGYRERFPDLSMIKGAENEAAIGAVTQTNRIRVAGDVITTKRTVYKLIPAQREDEEASTKFLRTVIKWKQCLLADKSEGATMPAPEGLDPGYARKLIETVMVGTGLKIKIGIRKEEKGAQRDPMETRVKRRDEGAVIIKAEGRSYAELLKEIKSDVKNAGKDIEVTKVRRTQKGDILLQVRGGKEMAKRAKDTLAGITGKEIRVAEDRSKKVLHILGVDGVTTREEAEDELREQFGKERNAYLKITSIRDAYGENQNLTVEADWETAEKMISAGAVKIGWVRCKVRARVEVTKCYRCHEFGHTRTECKGPDRGDKCLRCGGEGHQAKNCVEAHEFCFTCGAEGHRNNSTKCPAYWKLITAARARGLKKASRKANW